jgi:signal transduction histidine kinase
MKAYFFKILLIFYVFFSQSVLLAQVSKIDSLEILLPTLTEDSLKTATLVELCWAYRNINIKKSEAYCQQAEELARTKHFTYLLAKTLNHLGLLHSNKAEYDLALIHYFKAIDVAQANMYQDQLGYAYHSIAEVYRKDEKKVKQAIVFVNKALQIFKEGNFPDGVAFCHLTLGRIDVEKKAYQSAQKHYAIALKIWKELNNENLIANVYFDIGGFYKEQKDYEQAYTYLYRANLTFNKLNNIRGKLLVLNHLADINLLKNQPDSAIIKLQYGLSVAKNSGITELIEEFYTNLASTYAAQQNYEQAYQYEKILNHFKDSIKQIQRNIQIVETETKYDVAHKVKAIQTLQQQNEEKQDMLYLLGIMLLGTIIIGIFLYKNIRQKQEVNRQLIFQREQIKIQNNQLAHLNHEILLQKEELVKLNAFKNKLFSIISHDLRNPLASLKGAILLFKTNILTPSEQDNLIDKLSNDLQSSSYLLDNLLNWTQSQMQGLKVKSQKLVLYDLVKENIALLASQAALKSIYLENHVSENIVAFADLEMTKTVIRNLLHNAIKYSFPQGIVNTSAYIDKEQRRVVVSIKDNGRGMNQEEMNRLFSETHFSKHGTANEKGSGLGLLLSKEFVEKNGGELWVESIENKGSTFIFSLPYEIIA